MNWSCSTYNGSAITFADISDMDTDTEGATMKYQPQLAKLGKGRFTEGRWITERKWDGMRALFEFSDQGTLIFSRTGQDLRPQFPDLCDLHLSIPEDRLPCILDGEIVAFSPECPDTEDLERLQMRLGDKKARRRYEIPVDVRFFDILDLQGDVRHVPLHSRRVLLQEVLQGAGWAFPEDIPTGSDTPDHWEGTVVKRAESTYQSGKRNSDWQKYKFVLRATLRVTGLTPGKGSRLGSFGAATVCDEKGVHRGQVGSGFSDVAIGEILQMVGDAQTGKGPWPLIEVEYRFPSKTGLLVNTAFKGVRMDKEEADVL